MARSSSINAALTVQRKGNLTVIELQEASLINRTELERVCAAIEQVIDATNPPQILMSFTNVNHVSSTFLGRLIAFHKKAKHRGGTIALTNVNANLSDLFAVTKLDSQIPVFRPGEKPLPATVAWVTLLSVMSGSGLIGVYFIVHLALGGWSSSGRPGADWTARLAMLYFILTIPLAVGVYLVRRVFVQVGREVQWLAVGVFALLAVVLFIAFLLAR